MIANFQSTYLHRRVESNCEQGERRGSKRRMRTRRREEDEDEDEKRGGRGRTREDEGEWVSVRSSHY